MTSTMSQTHYDLLMLFLRVIVGPTVFLHGYNKFFGGGKIPGTARWFDSMGMKPNGTIHAWAAATTETVSGVLITVGFLTPLAAAGVIGIMTVAGVTTHRHAFFIIKEGFEYVMILGLMAFTISAFGPGKWSLDHAIGLTEGLGNYLDGNWLGTAVPLVLGLGAGLGLLAACYRPPAKESKD